MHQIAEGFSLITDTGSSKFLINLEAPKFIGVQMPLLNIDTVIA